ncbi:DEAD/DEAH box helicase family protein [Shewanella indica]|uniref:DEAD/DEAH box helicase family protein n=1 Tax=Shewanella TaxID=22 RepID=UPI00399A3591
MGAMQNIEYVGGQMGFFFGDQAELAEFIQQSQQHKKTNLRVQVKANDFFARFPLKKIGVVTRYNLNVAAIKTLNHLEEAGAEATHDDQLKLAQYVGWGACPQAFDPNNDKWAKRYNELKCLLTPEQYKKAQQSTLSAFYTPDFLSAAIYDGLIASGVDTGSFLDTSAGVGGLIRTMPKSLVDSFKIHLVEQDQISSAILEKLYPSAQVHNCGFEEAKLKTKQSVIFHNPPFGQAPIFDRQNTEFSGLSLHNYFMARGASLLAEKGWMIAIVSRSFMDAKLSKSRELVAKYATLKGAVRLPKQVFEVTTGANATVDVLVFEQGADSNPNWTQSVNVTDEQQNDYLINQYFIDNPDRIIGKMKCLSQFQGNNVHCVGDNHFESATTTAIKALFAPLSFEGRITEATSIAPALNPQVTITEKAGCRIGSFAVGSDGEVYQLAEDDSWKDAEFTGTAKQRLIKMCGIRHALMTLLEAEQNNHVENELDTLRAELNDRYDAFVKAHGFIHDTANQRVAKLDPTNYNLLSLEVNYNAGLTQAAAKKLGIKAVKASAKKAEIFSKRVLMPWSAPTSANTVEDALIASMNVYGFIDLAYCARLLSISESKFINNNEGLSIFNDNGKWVTKNVFLSGDVKSKLAAVSSLSCSNEVKERYQAALMPVIPSDVTFDQFKTHLGASWVPADVYREFVTLLCGDKLHSQTQIDITYAANQWHFHLFCLPYQLETRLGSDSAYRFSKLFPCLMNGRSIQVTLKGENGGRVVDQQASLENELNSEKILAEWDAFLLERSDIQAKLTSIYNEKFNRLVRMNASADVLALPDSNQAIQLRDHQLNAVYRAICEGRLLIAHEVGAGKTFTIAALVHESIRLGLKQRCIIVVPNHLTSQFASGYLQLYPQDQITVLSPDDLSPSTRKATLMRLKTGAKVVICPESSFASIPADDDIEQKLIEFELTKLDTALSDLKKSDARFTVKGIENKKAKLKERLLELGTDKRKSGLSISDLGVDMLVLDEAHYIKNLAYESSRLTNVRGCGTPTGSKRAWDWYLKINVLKRKNENGLGVYFSTGTPISNTLLEAYTFIRYLDEDLLLAQGIESIDDFVSCFAKISSDFEVAATGAGFKTVTRLREFANLPELQAVWGSIADCVNESELAAYLPKLIHNNQAFSAIPPITGGKPRQLIVEPTDAQLAYSKYLVKRAKDFKSSPIENDNMLVIMSEAKKASVDMRLLSRSTPIQECGNKIPACVKITADKYHATTAEKGTQIIFLDIGVPNRDGRHCVYDQIKAGLIAQGVNPAEIVFAQDFKTPLQKTALYSKLNTGVYRVIVASTSTLGCGANVNQRLVGITVLDAPYRPSDLTQRLGRGIRQGNLLYQANPDTFTLDVTFIATKNSLDSFLFQVLENKQKFISAFNSANTISAVADDISNTELTFAELKAETSGSPLVLEMVTLTKTIQRLDAERNAYIRDQRNASWEIENFQKAISKYQRLLDGVTQDMASGNHTVQAGDQFCYINDASLTFNKYTEAANNISETLAPTLESISQGFYKDRTIKLGKFAGYDLSAKAEGRSVSLIASSKTDYRFSLDISKASSIGRQILNTINSFITNFDQQIERFSTEISTKVARLAVANDHKYRRFDKLDQLLECKQRMIELKQAISELERQGDTDAGNDIDDIVITDLAA